MRGEEEGLMWVLEKSRSPGGGGAAVGAGNGIFNRVSVDRGLGGRGSVRGNELVEVIWKCPGGGGTAVGAGKQIKLVY